MNVFFINGTVRYTVVIDERDILESSKRILNYYNKLRAQK